MDHIVNYFNSERLQCIIGLIIATVFISTSIYFLYQGKPIFKGLAYAYLPLALLLTSICVGVVFRTPKDISRVTGYLDAAPDKIESIELPRMNKVMRSFALVKKVELGIVIVGILLALFCWNRELLRGVALGMITLGIILYFFDHFAELRGKGYLEFLQSL